MPSIIEILNTLNVNKTTKQHIERIENFNEEFKVSPIKDLFNEVGDKLNDNSVLSELKKSLESYVITSQNPSKEELGIANKELQKKIKEIGQLSFIEKSAILTPLKKAEEDLSGFVKQTQTINADEKRKKAYTQAKDALRAADIEILKINIKNNKNIIKNIAELYKLINPSILGLVRAFSIKDEITKIDIDRDKNLISYLNLIKEKLKLPTDQDINLSSLGKISDWSVFKLSLKKTFEQNKLKEKNTIASSADFGNFDVSENINILRNENSKLTKEVSELKEKITSLEIQLSSTEENKLIANIEHESVSLNIATSNTLKEQDDDRINDLDDQLFHLAETNKALTEEVDEQQKLNNEQKQNILDLRANLEKLKTALETKGEQISENLQKLKQHEEKLTSKENDLFKNKHALEASTNENRKLSDNLADLSKKLDEKTQLLTNTESELNILRVKSNQIELLKKELESKLKQTELFNTGILQQKQEEITKLNGELKHLNEQLVIAKANFTSYSNATNHKILLLEANINEKESFVKQLKKELEDSEKTTNQYKNEVTELKIKLEAKSQELDDNASQIKKLIEQFENSSTQKNATQLAEYEALKAQYAVNINDSEEKLATLREEIALTNNEKLGLKENVGSLETNLQEEKSKFSASKQKISELQNELYTLRSNLTSTEQDLKFKLNQTREEKKAISEKLETVTKERESFISKAYDVLPNFISSDSKDYFTLVPTDSNKEFEGILQKIDLLKKQKEEKEENEEKIEELQHQLEMLKIESDKKDAKIFELKLPNIDLDDENTKTLIQEKDHLQERVTSLTNQLIQLEEQNKELYQATTPANYSLEDNWDSDNEETADDNELTAYQEELISIRASLKETKTELEQKNGELKRLQEKLFTQTEESKLKIIKLKDELANLRTNDSSKQEEISELTNLLDELNKLKSQQEKLISELQSQLISKNAELKGLFDQHSVNDKLITNLKNTISIYKNELTVAKEAIATLNEKLETKQKDDSNLKVDHAKLGTELSEKILELNKIQTELKSTKEQLEEARAKNITQGGLTMPGTQTDLIDFENPMPNQDHPDHKANFPDENGSSSGHSSRHSSSNSHASSENINSLLNPLFSHNQNPSSEDEAFTEQHSLRTNSSNSSLTRSYSLPNFAKPSVSATTLAQRPTVPIINPKNNGTTMTRPEQPDAQVDNTSSIHERGVINAFNEEHHEEISQAFRAEFSRIATAAANTLFNGNIVTNSDLPTFKNELDEKANEEVKRLILALSKSNKKELLSGIIEKIHSDGLNHATYLEEVKNSASYIFGTLSVAQQNYKEHIADIGKNLLINLCVEKLETEVKVNLPQMAKRELENKIITNRLLPIEQHTETIKIAAEELVTKILETNNIKAIIRAAKTRATDNLNLLEASTQKLQEQLEQQVDQTFDHYFPIVHLNPIFQKIKDGEVLSEEEIQKIPSELQYADTPEDFALGLTANYSHLKFFPISKDVFDKSVLILRKNALSPINQTLINNDELVDLSAEAWLEKKLELVTDKSIALELNKKQQKDLDNKFYKLFPLSPLEAMAVTHKSVDELTDELEKLHGLKVNATDRLYKIFAEIENKLKEYPNLIKDISLFKEYLNIQLTHAFPENKIKWSVNSNKWKVNENETKIILAGINRRLGDDISKWNLFNHANDKLAEEIARDISTYPIFINSNFELADIKKLVTNALRVLYKFPNLKDILNKREQWKTDIKSLFAFTEKLRPNSQFSEEIEKRKDILEDLLALKQLDAEEQTVVIPKGVYIPNKCRIIPNFQSDPSDTYQFDVQANIFYKQKALAPNETVTFAQKLENEKICKWSATHSADKCLTYKIEKKFFRRKKSYIQEISFAQMIHSVNSFKNAKTCTLNFGNCSDAMKEKLYLFAHAYNELRRDNGPQKGPRIMCHMKNPPDMDKDKITKAKEEIKTKLNLHGEELADTSEKLKDDTISHKTIRSRG